MSKLEEALFAFSKASSFLPSGKLEKVKNNATAAKTPATIRYKILILVTVTTAALLSAVPNKKKLTMMGP